MRKLQNTKMQFSGLWRALVTAVLLLSAPFLSRAQLIVSTDCCPDTLAYRFGLSSNLPYGITYVPGYGLTSIPSLSLEIYPSHGRWSFGLDAEWPMWKHPEEHRYLQANCLSAWTRCYFNERQVNGRFRGWYASGGLSAARYGIGFNSEKGWQGEGLGTSVGLGHKWALGRHFTIDMGLALGVFYSGYDPYIWGDDGTGLYYYDYFGDPEYFQKRNQRLFWAGPTRFYINIGFDFWRRRQGRAEDR